MFPITFRVTCVRAAAGLYLPYFQSRWVSEAVTVDNDALHASHSFNESGGVVASLRDAARWVEAIEGAVATPLA
jgi:hypothetical protein